MANDVTIKLGDADKLQKTINSYLQNLGISVEDEFQEAADEIGKEAVQKLKGYNFGRKRWKNYPKGWVYKPGKFRNGNFECLIYNAKHGSLTHLIEYGHPIFTKAGQKVGDAAAFPHIGPVDEWVQSELPKRIAQKMRDKN